MHNRTAAAAAGNNGMLEDIILRMARSGALRFDESQPFELRHDGLRSCFYMQGRGALTDDSELMALLGAYTAIKVRQIMGADNRAPTLIGIPTAGTPIAVAASVASVYIHKEDANFPLIASRHMRIVARDRSSGGQRWVDGEMEGPPDKVNKAFMTVDNAITTGKTLIQHASRLEDDGYPVKAMTHIVFLDRLLGSTTRLRELGFKIAACVTMQRVVDTLVHHRVWPEAALRKLEAEIALR